MNGTLRINPADVVTTSKSERPAANSNVHKDTHAETILLGVAPRDMAALAEIVSQDAALNLATTLDDLSKAVANDNVSVVVTPLTTDGFDALDVAQHLAKIGYYGQLQILSPELPKPMLVQREIEAVAKSVEVELVTPRAIWRTLA